jgi:hypothetical protein
MLQKFYFNTGVKFQNNPNLFGSQIWKNGTKQIPFFCDVPENSIFVCASDDPNLKFGNIVAKIENSDLISKFAYFKNS